MRTKKTSEALKRHRQTFHLARHDPERWEQEKNDSLSESLHEARERARIAEREVEITKKLLRDSQREASLIIVCGDELPAHQTYRLTTCARKWQLQKWQ